LRFCSQYSTKSGKKEEPMRKSYNPKDTEMAWSTLPIS